MANPEHVNVVRQGTTAILEWRWQNPGVCPDLSGADLTGADLRRALLSEADLTEADLRRANLHTAHLDNANLRGAGFAWANLSDADLSGANLSDANFGGADLFGANLAEANLRRASLRLANLRRANLRRARLTGADLHRADLTDTDLAGADLRGANLSRANLFRGGLTGANLSGAHLSEANLGAAWLAGVKLSKARFGLTSLGACDLSQATGLSTVNHQGPSSVGVDTLILSFRGAGNKLTPDLEIFFVRAGVPREFLAKPPRIGRAVGYLSCFISYGQPDLNFAQRLRDDLAAGGVSCWVYALDATPGERTWPEIRSKQRESDKMVIICSVRALLRDGVLKEIEEQIDDDPDKMVPISRDNIWTDPGFRVVRAGRDLTPWLRDRNYADFSDESGYEESLQRLLKALRRKAEWGRVSEGASRST